MSETVQLQGDVKQWIGRCMLSDQHRFRRQFSKLKTIKNKEQRLLNSTSSHVMSFSPWRNVINVSKMFRIEFPDLPVTAEKQSDCGSD